MRHVQVGAYVAAWGGEDQIEAASSSVYLKLSSVILTPSLHLGQRHWIKPSEGSGKDWI